MSQVAPHGAWESEISIEMITAGAVGLGDGTCCNGSIYWTESRADQGGRTSIWRQDSSGVKEELTKDAYVRTMVHEYGGGAWAVADDVIVYSTFPSHQCFVLKAGNHQPLTPADQKLRYADFCILPSLGKVIAVREDHRESDLDCVNTIVVLDLDSDNADGGTVLLSGSDFYSTPRLSNDGQLCWVEWDHPNMPWDATRLKVGTPTEDWTAISAVVQVAGTQTTAPCYPTWHGKDLIFLDDTNGFWNFYRYNGHVTQINNDDHDYCYPAWVFGDAYHLLADGTIVATKIVDATMELGLIKDGLFNKLRDDGCLFSPAGDENTTVAIVGYPDRPAQLEILTESGQWRVLRRSAELDLDPSWFSRPQSISWEGPQGPVHAWYYPPTNPHFTAPDGEKPPLKVLSHGGPTGMALPSLRLERQYWTSRGWAIVDVNYGGSAGYGRAYRERLRGQWGIVDVQDCCDAAQAVAKQGLADPSKLAIEGGSAGGYTTLAALTSSEVFSAGNCLFGLAELEVFCKETHKFESRYIQGLIGGTPQEKPELFKDRSPIHHLDRLNCPMLIQQGEDDMIVPANQAVLMADAVRAKGLPVALLMFPGEGHGWRRAETIKTSVQAALSFFGQVFGYEPVGVAKLEIENLD